MSYLFTSEAVSEGHPDKVADQISDALLDEFLKRDPESKVACETLVTTGLVVCAGEVKTNSYVDVQETVRNVIKNIGYTDGRYKFESESCGILSAIHEQSQDINRGVEREKPEEQGAGDQGMMFGYATDETHSFMPLPLEISYLILDELTKVRKLKSEKMNYLRPDAKSQVTIEYNEDGKPIAIDTIVVSVQHDDFDADEKKMIETIKADIVKYIIPAVIENVPDAIKTLFNKNYKLYVNPTGKFVIGGPHGDTGVTGRKIVVDTYGGMCAHGGGAFSGKDPSKVDRSAAYAARHIAKNLVAAQVARKVTVQLAYAIGIAQPVSVFIDTQGTAKVNFSDPQIADIVKQLFDLTPYGIISRFGLKNPIYLPTAANGHFGRDAYAKKIEVFYQDNHTEIVTKDNQTHYYKTVDFFPWEKLDFVDTIKNKFFIQ